MITASYKELKVWQQSIDLVKVIYTVTQRFPKEELYGLTSQMRRAAVSIPSNIAEGSSRRSAKEYIRFLRIAHASSAELDTHCIIAKELGFMDKDMFYSIASNIAEVGRMLNGLQNSLESRYLKTDA